MIDHKIGLCSLETVSSDEPRAFLKVGYIGLVGQLPLIYAKCQAHKKKTHASFINPTAHQVHTTTQQTRMK